MITCLFVPALMGQEESEAWHTDFDAAVTLAAESGTYLLVDFSGSDWCGWCKKLDQEVFSKEEFLTKVQDRYILVVLDFPRSKEVPNAKRNGEVRDLFKVTGYPTVLLMDESAKPIAKTGYVEGGPEAYLAHMATLEEWSAKVGDEVKKAESAPEASKAEAITGLIAFLDGLGEHQLNYNHHFSLAFPQVADVVGEAFVLDPTDAKGLKSKAALFLLNTGNFTDKLRVALAELDPKNEKGYLEKLFFSDLNEKMMAEDGAAVVAMVKDFLKDKTIQDEQMNAMVRYWAGYAALSWSKDKATAIEFLTQAKDLKPANPRLVSSIDKLLQEAGAGDK